MKNIELGKTCYDLYVRDVFPDEECKKFMRENNFTKDRVRDLARNYLISCGTFKEIKEYDRAKNNHLVVSVDKKIAIKGSYYLLSQFIIKNYDNDEKLKQEIFDKYPVNKVYNIFNYNICKEGTSSISNEDLRKIKIALEKFKIYLSKKRALNKKDNIIDNNSREIMAFNYILNYMNSFYTNLTRYHLDLDKRCNAYSYKKESISILLNSNKPEYVELANEFNNFSLQDRIKKYHPEVILNCKQLCDKLIEGNLTEIDYYLLKDDNLTIRLFELLAPKMYNTSSDLKVVRTFIKKLNENNYEEKKEAILNMKIILKDYGEVSLDTKKYIINYLEENDIPVNMYYYRFLLDVYFNDITYFTNNKKEKVK